MKGLKSHPSIERLRRINFQINLARHTAGLVLALAGLIGAATLAFEPAMVASAQAAQIVSFGAKTDFATGDKPRSVAVGDFNGDGTLDLAVANAGTVSILPGTGTGSFGAKTDFVTGSNPSSVAVGDFNGDGKLDLAVANLGSIFVNDTGPDTVSILLNGTGPIGFSLGF